MSRDCSPPLSSDDSAVGSLHSADNSKNNHDKRLPNVNNRVPMKPPHQPNSNKSSKQSLVNSDQLEYAAKLMRTNNVGLISRSVRTVMSCFDDFDVQKFETRSDYLINFISNGMNSCDNSVQRPVSILWPETYEKLVGQIAILDAYLINNCFREKPVDWLIQQNLTSVPACRNCKEGMTLAHETQAVTIIKWICDRSPVCSSYSMPVQRPSFFSNYENVSLDKLLFSLYYWATCTPGDELYGKLNIQPHILSSIWRRYQNVCRTALEKSYPRLRLTNMMDSVTNSLSCGVSAPIDLVSIKLNDVFIVCAKHPHSNLVRLSLYIPKTSLYSFVSLTESWFAHGAHIRVSEEKFLELKKKRDDLNVTLVPRLDMIAKDGHFCRESAFGYLTCQLAHVLKDYDSSTLTQENLKLLLAEMQWRELYGTTPYDAFTNIVSHIAQYGDISDCYSEPYRCDSQKLAPHIDEQNIDDSCDSIWVERNFYATVDPVDSRGKVVQRYGQRDNLSKPPQQDVRIQCHDCNLWFECFDFSLHMIEHVEFNRKDTEGPHRQMFECKHCFKVFNRDAMTSHSTLFRCALHTFQYGCRICCIQMDNRADYIDHMRRLHFEHETPYRCPTCKFASSFQRDVFIHFQEEHRHSMVFLCPLCLRSFTVAKPELITPETQARLSRIIYNHIAKHYVLSKGFTCSNCSLCFLDSESLMEHKNKHHNPLEIRVLGPGHVQLEPFIVTDIEKPYCVKALPVELFIANKRPNKVQTPKDVIAMRSIQKSKQTKAKSRHQVPTSSSSSSSSDSEDNNLPMRKSSGVHKNIFPSSSNSEEDVSQNGDDLIHVRGSAVTRQFLQNGCPTLQVPTSKSSVKSQLTSQKLIEYLSKMKKADNVIANQSVILTTTGKPARCCECFHYISVDHYVSSISCEKCSFTTNCPRAAIAHNKTHTEPTTLPS